MNKPDEMIEKSFSQIKHYLSLNNYKIVTKKGFNIVNEVKRKQTQIDVVYNVEGLIQTYPKIYLYYCYDTNVSKNILDNIIHKTGQTISEKDILLIITKEYASTINDLLSSKYANYYINIYKIQELQYNILEHSFVPRHIKLNEMEKNELYLKYNIENDKQLPQISRFDPVSKAILLRPGEVCKIIRHDKISLQNDYYRICVG
jgi:DNA-directed RNA polymerase subunit H (RpoH/RPB5)